MLFGKSRAFWRGKTEGSMNIRKIAIRFLAFGLAAAACLGLAACVKKSDDPKLEHSLTRFYCGEDTMTYFYADGQKLEDKIAGNITKLTSVDGQSGIMTAATALYHIDETGILKIYPAAVSNAVLSLDGRYALFATAQRVFLYDNESKQYEQVLEVEAKRIISLALSPDGSAGGAAIVTDDDRIESYVIKNGSSELYGEDKLLFAVSDGGAISYYLEAPDGTTTGSLHCVKNGRDSLIAENASSYFELNRDLTEITFDINEKTHISLNGGKAKKLVDASVFSYKGEQYSGQGGDAVTVLLKNTDTLLDSVFYTNVTGEDQSGNRYAQYSCWYVNSSLSVNKLVGGTDQFQVSENGKELLCVVDGGLYRVSAYNPKKPELVAGSCYSFCAAPDLGTIYSIDPNGNLRIIGEGRDSDIVVTGVQLAKRMNNGTVICYAPSESNGTLLWLRDGKANAIATNVSFFEVYPQVAMYLSDYDESSESYSLYTSTDGVEFTFGLDHVGIGK